MSTIWTPSGERPVGGGSPAPPGPGPGPGPGAMGPAAVADGDEVSEEELAEHMAQVQAEIRATPASAIVANHCIGLFQLAVIHLDPEAPELGEAKLAIDAIAGVLEAVGDRLGPEAASLHDALAQLQLRYVEVRGSAPSGR